MSNIIQSPHASIRSYNINITSSYNIKSHFS